MNYPQEAQLTLTRETDDGDVELELAVTHYVYPAEPSVGILYDWAELSAVTLIDGTPIALNDNEEEWLERRVMEG